MDKNLLNLVPRQYLCPYCGEWHNWNRDRTLSYFDSSNYQSDNDCPHIPRICGHYKFYFLNGRMYFSVKSLCDEVHDIDDWIYIDSIVEESDFPRVTFKVSCTTGDCVNYESCEYCDADYRKYCNYCKLGEAGDGRNMTIELGFIFDEEDYFKYSESARKAKRQLEIEEEREKNKKTAKKQHKEETTMSTAKTPVTSIKNFLYERSPKENVEMLKEWSEKYKPTLRWAIPVAAVYGAYKILNSKEFDLNVNNISETAEKKLGVKLDLLDNKKALKELMVIGGLSSTAYGAMKAVTGIISSKQEKDMSVEDFESTMDKVESISQKFAWIQPKTEDMLPIALSVLMVYVALHKPTFEGKITGKVKDLTEDWQIKIGTYVDLAKMYIQDKFNLDLSDEEQQKKLKVAGFFVAVIGVFVFLYGKKVLGGKNEDEDDEEVSGSITKCVESAKTLIQKVAPTVYTTLVTYFVSKKLLELDEDINVIETEATNVNEDGKDTGKKGKRSKKASTPAEKDDVTSEDSADTESKEETAFGVDAEDPDGDYPEDSAENESDEESSSRADAEDPDGDYPEDAE